MLDVMMPELIRATKDFYNIAGMKTVLYDADRRFLYSYPSSMCEFCEEIRKCPSLTEKCFECDNHGFDVCDKTMKPYVYKCHMGLSEIITPIVENGVIIGYMMIGQILMEGDTNKVRALIDLAGEKYGVDKNEKVITGIKRISKPGLRVYANKEELPRVLGGLGIAILSTNQGVITDKKARELQVGGEVLAFVW